MIWIRESPKGFFLEITFQVTGHQDIPAKIEQILHCFDQLPIEVHTDFWFFCHSKTRDISLVYPTKNTSYETSISFLRNFEDIDLYVANFHHLGKSYLKMVLYYLYFTTKI